MDYNDLIKIFKLLGLLVYEVSDGIMISIQNERESEIVQAILKFNGTTRYEFIFNNTEDEEDSGYNMIRQRVYFNEESKFIKIFYDK